MSQNITFNGLTYTIPDVSDENWGDNLTNFFIAIPQGALQKTGGVFTLTADTNFGANFGLLVQYLKSRSTQVSSTGVIRLAVGDTIGFRNNANSADLVLAVNGSDALTFNGVTLAVVGNYITALTGDVTASGPGSAVATLSPNVIVDSQINSAAAISFSKLAPLASGNILVGSAGNVATSVAVTGDISLSAAGGTGYEGIVPVFKGGTGQTTTSAAFNALSPMTTAGDMIYGGASGTGTRLAVGSAMQVLQSVGGVPSWQTVNLSGINYIGANPSAEVDTSGWATYADAAANIPVDGTGGTATGLTFSRSTSSPLVGVASFLLQQANSTSLQGKGVSYAFTIDTAYKASQLAIQFNFNASATFVASNGVTAPLNDGTTSTNAGNSDLEVFIYDVTNAVLIPVSPQVIAAKGSTNFVFKGLFQASSNSTSYRLILHVATTSANATGWSFKFDSVSVGPQTIIQGPPVTDWTAYTPTFTGFGTVTGVTAVSRRVGDSIQLSILATSGTPTATEARISFPTGIISAGSNKIGALSLAGPMIRNAMVGGGDQDFALMEESVGYITFGIQSSGSAAFTKVNGNVLVGASELFSVIATVPVTGWSSTVLMSNDTSSNVVGASYSLSANSSAARIPFDTLIVDTNGAVTPGASFEFTAPVSGLYQCGCITLSGSAGSIQLYKNGSVYAYVGAIGNTSILVPCLAGDTLYFNNANGVSITGGSPSTDNGAICSFFRLSGPSAIATTDTIAAVYKTATAQVIAAGATDIINFDTVEIDTTGAVATGGSWKFTAPISGLYSISASIAYGRGSMNPVNNGDYGLFVYKNGSAWAAASYLNGGASPSDLWSGMGFQLSNRLIRLLAGDTLDVRSANGNASGNATLVANSVYNYISIQKVGN